MSQPIHYVKDSQLFTVVIEDFASLMDGRQHKTALGFAGGQKWHFYFQTVFQDEVPLLDLLFEYDCNDRNVKSLVTHLGFIIGSTPFRQWRLDVERSFRVETSYLDRFLENGALKIQIEIRVDVIIDKNGIRKFNFHDPFEGCVTLTSENWTRGLYVDKHLISYHSPYFVKKIRDGKNVIQCPNSGNRSDNDAFLQLLHGVPLSVDWPTFYSLPDIADVFQVTNIFQYCKLDKLCSFYAPVHLLPSNCSARIMKNVVKKGELQRFTSKRLDDLDDMSTELLKAIVKKFFSFVADNDDNDKITVSERINV